MALDISKFGRRPYQRLDRPEPIGKSTSHVKRYFFNLLRGILSALIPLASFLSLAWFWDFGMNEGFGQKFVWLIVSGALIIIWLSLVLWFKRVSIFKHPKLAVYLFVLAVLAVVSIFSGPGMVSSFGLDALSGNLFLAALLAGFLWIIVLSNFRSESGFLKKVLLSFFLGSTALVLFIIYTMFFGGGYQNLERVVAQSWLNVFAITIFLILSFAMLQKKFPKAIWTAVIGLHLLVLIFWDYHLPWIILLLGTSGLLVFQIVYAKKLWQRNFIYPLQIWIIAFLLLVIPVKIFTGKTIVQPESYTRSEMRAELFRAHSLSDIFGNGPGSSVLIPERDSLSFVDINDIQPATYLPKKIFPNSLAALKMEFGWLGLLLAVILLCVFIGKGIRFLLVNLDKLKEQSMSESVYLGIVTFLASVLLIASLWFSVWNFSVFWPLALFVGLSVALWDASKKDENSPNPPKAGLTESGKEFGLPASPGKIVTIVLIIAYCLSLFFGVRVVQAGKKMQRVLGEADSTERAKLLNDAVRLNPWNTMYSIARTKDNVQFLSLGASLDAQKNAIAQATKTLFEISNKSTNALAHWWSAQVFQDLEVYAEGSSGLARESYLKAVKYWPNNAALRLALAAFYRDSVESLVSASLSAQDLQTEARSHLEKALDLESAYLPARLELALVKETSEGPDAALRELEPWADQSPEILYHVGRLYFNKGDFAKAAETFAEVIRLIPTHSNARYSLGISYFRLGQYDDSLTEFQEVLRQNSGNDDVQEKINQVQAKIDEEKE